MELTRRAMLGALGGLAVGGTVASVVGTSIAADPKTKRFEQINGDFGWKPHKLDPKECAAVAYDGYWHKGLGCAYGAFYAIVGLMGEKYGAPYNQFPFAMLEVGKGGISDWGTICGALLGPASAYAFSGEERNAMRWCRNSTAGTKRRNCHLQPRRSRQGREGRSSHQRSRFRTVSRLPEPMVLRKQG